MIGRFSILKSLDLEKIDKNIKIYESKTGNKPYLFMNKDTIYETFCECNENFVTKKEFEFLNLYGKTGTYAGYKLFVNEDLEFGEVELR